MYLDHPIALDCSRPKSQKSINNSSIFLNIFLLSRFGVNILLNSILSTSILLIINSLKTTNILLITYLILNNILLIT
jgi:hypothetical protein